MRDILGGVTAPRGFRASAVPCGVKYINRDDLIVIASETPSKCAGMFTSNRIKAAPVLLSREHAARGTASAIVANSGNANACTGEEGIAAAAAMVAETGRLLGIDPRDVLVASTGVIGKPFPIQKVLSCLPKAVSCLSADYSPAVARAIMTTDTVPKEVAVEVVIGETAVRIGGIAKGAGMIRPDMATMLVFVTTDADISQASLVRALQTAISESFNCITVDGDMSTNDTVFIIANGRAANTAIRSGTKNYEVFTQTLTAVCKRLACEIVRDAEGATKFVTINVGGAPSNADAKQVGYAIANSPLVKTAIFGNDPNWGRIICAAGYSGVAVNEANISIVLNDTLLFERGRVHSYDEKALRGSMENHDIYIDIDLGMGRSNTTIYTSDLSHDYITINAEYTT